VCEAARNEPLGARRVHLPIRGLTVFYGQVVREAGEVADGIDTEQPAVVECANDALNHLGVKPGERRATLERAFEDDRNVAGIEKSPAEYDRYGRHRWSRERASLGR